MLLRVGRLIRQEPARVQELRAQFQRNAIAPLFIARFITGLRNAAGLVAGASGVPLGRFLAVSAAAALAWSALIALEYYFAGQAILGAPTWLQIVLIIVECWRRLLRFASCDGGLALEDGLLPRLRTLRFSN